MAGKVYTLQEVAKHGKKGDCWLIISGKVYNVTPFLEEHPGGEDILLMSTGRDATPDFEDVGHSNDAQQKMKEFYIGEIDTSTLPAKKYTPPAASSKANKDSGDSSKILLFILPLLIIGVALLLRFYSKKE